MPFIVRTVLIALILSAIPSTASASPPRCWHRPAEAWVVDPFREPPCPWCAGNRGIDFGLQGSHSIRAVGGGVVTFAGQVAGTNYVVVEHADGWKLTYGKLQSMHVGRGDVVAGRAVVGTAVDSYFFGLRVDGTYRDPSPYLGRLRSRPRLIPIDGGALRPGPPATLSCAR